MGRRLSSAALATALLVVVAVGARGQSTPDSVTLILERATAEELMAALEVALGGTTTTTAPTTTAPPPTTTTTASPPGCVGVDVAAGANLVVIAGDYPAGTTFCLAAGTYPITTDIPIQTGDRWIGALGPAGERLSIITGSDSTFYFVEDASQNVLLANVVVERFVTASQQSPNRGAQTFWTLDNVEIRFNHNRGWSTHTGQTVRNSYIHHNGQIGIGGNGDDVLVEGNEIAWNNPDGKTTPGFEGGGSKWLNAINLTVRGNWVHHNCGNGLWSDGPGNQNHIFQDNVSEDNWASGINFEMGTGPALITGNVIRRNAFGKDGPICAGTSGGLSSGGGQGGIRANDSNDVTITDNILVGNDGGVSATDSDRSGLDPDVRDLSVTGNHITWTVNRHGVQDTDPGSDPFAASANNHFEGNTYVYLGSDPAPFQWAGNKSWAAWQSAGHDLTGSFS